MKTELMRTLRAIDTSLEKLGELAAASVENQEAARERLHSLSNALAGMVTLPEDMQEVLRQLKELSRRMDGFMQNAEKLGTRVRTLENRLGQR